MPKKIYISTSRIALMLAASAVSGLGGIQEQAIDRALDYGGNRPVKRCVRCGKDHYHNNSFCSASCCKAYRADKRKKR